MVPFLCNDLVREVLVSSVVTKLVPQMLFVLTALLMPIWNVGSLARLLRARLTDFWVLLWMTMAWLFIVQAVVPFTTLLLFKQVNLLGFDFSRQLIPGTTCLSVVVKLGLSMLLLI